MNKKNSWRQKNSFQFLRRFLALHLSLSIRMKVTALLVAVSFVFPYLAWALESTLYSKSENLICFQGTPLRIPEKVGKIEHAFQAPSRFVIHIQDLHCNFEVQSRIADLLDWLASQYQLQLVGIEGAHLPVNVTKLSTFPDQAVKRAVGQWFMQQGKMSGTEFYAACGNHPVFLEGIENSELYVESQSCLARFLTDETQGNIQDLRDALSALKSNLYNQELAKLDHKASAFAQGEISPIDYARFLANYALTQDVALEDYVHLQHYLTTSENVLLNFDYDSLFTDLEKVEQVLREKLYTSPTQRELDQLLHRLLLMEKLFNISATPAEVAEFRSQPEQFKVQNFFQFLSQYSDAYALNLDPGVQNLDQLMEQVDRFYFLADQRSQKFVANLLQRMDAHHLSLAVLTTGGFHTPHILEILRQQNIGYLSIKPRMMHWDAINPYFSLLRKQRTPLEKLLAQNQEKFALSPYQMPWPDAKYILDESSLPLDKKIDYQILQLALVMWKLQKLSEKGALSPGLLQSYHQQLKQTYPAYNETFALLKEIMRQGKNTLFIMLPEFTGPYFAVIYPEKYHRQMPKDAIPFMALGGYEIALYPNAQQEQVAETVIKLEKRFSLASLAQAWFARAMKVWSRVAAWPAKALKTLSSRPATGPNVLRVGISLAMGLLPIFKDWILDQEQGRIHWGRALVALLLEALALTALVFISLSLITGDWKLLSEQGIGKTLMEIAAPALAMVLGHQGQVVVFREGKYVAETAQWYHWISLLVLHLMLAGCVVGGILFASTGLLGLGLIASLGLGALLGTAVAYIVHLLWNAFLVQLSPKIAAGLLISGSGNMSPEKFVKPDSPLQDHTVVSLQFEAGLDPGLLEELERWLGRILPRFLAQLTMTGGLGALMRDLIAGWKKNGADVLAIHPLYNDKIKGIVTGMPELPQGVQLGDLLRDSKIMTKTDITYALKLDWEGFNPESERAKAAFQQKIQIEVYERQTKFGQAPLYYLDAFYLKDGRRVHIFDELYPDDDSRDIQMAVYNEAAQILVKMLQQRGQVKEKILFVENEVFVSLPKNHFPQALRNHINHTVWKPGIYRPKEKSFRLLGFKEQERSSVVQGGRIYIDEYIASQSDLITGVGIYEHTTVLEEAVFPLHRHKIKSYNQPGIRSTNGALLDQWQGEELRYLLDHYKEKLNLPRLASDEELFTLLQRPENQAWLSSFQSRLDLIKAFYALELMLWLQQNQKQDMGGSTWLNATLAKAGLTPRQGRYYYLRYIKLLRQARSRESAWQELEQQMGTLAAAIFSNPIASNVRRLVSYKGPDKYQELLRQMMAWDKEALEKFKKSGIRIIIGGRAFDDNARALFADLKALAKGLGLEDQIAFIENYNIDEAPIIFRGVSATVMLSDEFLEASATSMMKALTDGGLLIGVWGGAMPELFNIMDVETGQPVDVLKTRLPHDEIVAGLLTGKYKITNGYLVTYAYSLRDTQSNQIIINPGKAGISHEQMVAGLRSGKYKISSIVDKDDLSKEEMGGRRPIVSSLLDGLVNLGQDFQSSTQRQGLLFQALATSPRVDIERSQARAHIRMWEETIRQRQTQQEFILKATALSAKTRQRILYQIGAPFKWNYLPNPADHEHANSITEAGIGLKNFLDSFHRLRLLGKIGEWSVLFHIDNGDIFRYLQYLCQAEPGLKLLGDKITEFQQAVKATTSYLEQLRLTLAALELVDKYVQALEKSEALSQQIPALISEIDFTEFESFLKYPIGNFIWHSTSDSNFSQPSPDPSLMGFYQRYKEFQADKNISLANILIYHSFPGNRFLENPELIGGDLIHYVLDAINKAPNLAPAHRARMLKVLNDMSLRIKIARANRDPLTVLEINQELMDLVGRWVQIYEHYLTAQQTIAKSSTPTDGAGVIRGSPVLIPAGLLPMFKNWVLDHEQGRIRWGRAMVVLLLEGLALTALVLISLSLITVDWKLLSEQGIGKTLLEIAAPALAMVLGHQGQVVVFRKGKYVAETARWYHWISLLILHLLLAGCVVGGILLCSTGLLGLGLIASLGVGALLGTAVAYIVHLLWNAFLVRLSPKIAAGIIFQNHTLEQNLYKMASALFSLKAEVPKISAKIQPSREEQQMEEQKAGEVQTNLGLSAKEAIAFALQQEQTILPVPQSLHKLSGLAQIYLAIGRALTFSRIQLQTLFESSRRLVLIIVFSFLLLMDLSKPPMVLNQQKKMYLAQLMRTYGLVDQEAAAFVRRYGLPLKSVEIMPLSQFPGSFFQKIRYLLQLGGFYSKPSQAEAKALYLPDVLLRNLSPLAAIKQGQYGQNLFSVANPYLLIMMINQHFSQHKQEIKISWLQMQMLMALKDIAPADICLLIHRLLRQANPRDYSHIMLMNITSSPLKQLAQNENSRLYQSMQAWLQNPGKKQTYDFIRAMVIDVLQVQSHAVQRLQSQSADSNLLAQLQQAHEQSILAFFNLVAKFPPLRSRCIGYWNQNPINIPDVIFQHRHLWGALSDMLKILPNVKIDSPVFKKSPKQFLLTPENAI